jgi:hypothetical protein
VSVSAVVLAVTDVMQGFEAEETLTIGLPGGGIDLGAADRVTSLLSSGRTESFIKDGGDEAPPLASLGSRSAKKSDMRVFGFIQNAAPKQAEVLAQFSVLLLLSLKLGYTGWRVEEPSKWDKRGVPRTKKKTQLPRRCAG